MKDCQDLWETHLLYKSKRNPVAKYMRDHKEVSHTKVEIGPKDIYKRSKIDKRRVDEYDDENLL